MISLKSGPTTTKSGNCVRETIVEARGFEVIPVDFAIGWETYACGIMCTSMNLWRES
jgi:hypothetical protein